MMKSHVIKRLAPIVREFTYCSRRAVYWRLGSELTPVVWLQQSQWGRALYVNVGVIPSAFIVRPYPPTYDSGGLTFRAEDADSPYQEDFCKLACDDENEFDEARLDDPFRWLFGWCHEYFGDMERVRRDVEDKTTLIGARAWPVFRDWAHHRLKTPREYYPDYSYFRQDVARPDAE